MLVAYVPYTAALLSPLNDNFFSNNLSIRAYKTPRIGCQKKKRWTSSCVLFVIAVIICVVRHLPNLSNNTCHMIKRHIFERIVVSSRSHIVKTAMMGTDTHHQILVDGFYIGFKICFVLKSANIKGSDSW